MGAAKIVKQNYFRAYYKNGLYHVYQYMQKGNSPFWVLVETSETLPNYVNENKVKYPDSVYANRSNLTEKQRNQIMVLYDCGVKTTNIARFFGVTYKTIHSYINRQLQKREKLGII